MIVTLHRIIKSCFILVILSLMFFMIMGCNVEKGVYDSMQDWKEQECFRDPSRNSPECLEQGDSYEAYERQRQRTNP
ncbi:hypothetical protein [Nitrospira sp. M1]